MNVIKAASGPSPLKDRHGYFVSLEVGRFFAAFFVAAFHASSATAIFVGAFPFRDFFRAGHAGVEYFFLLSGFLIYSIHRRDFGKTGAFRTFALKRAIRILPIYWIVTSVYFALAIVAPHIGHARSLDIGVILRNFTLTGSDQDLYLGVSWTLEREMVFYGLFALGLLFPWLRLKAFWLWQAAIVIAAIVHPEWSSGPRGSLLFGLYNLGFGGGALIAFCLERRPPGAAVAKVLLGFGAVFFLALFLTEWRIGAGAPDKIVVLGDHTSPLFYLCACALIIAGAVRLEKLWGFSGNRLLRLLGDSSYVLYLVHEACISTVVRLLRWPMPFKPEIIFVVSLIVAVSAAAAIHLTVEKPILTGLRSVLLSRSRQAPAAIRPVEEIS
ncbi:MAG TPA: acyltransferase [Rhizomicrobium sp.]|jgi:hypothetical protein|nr:acyltransferase [Rhizomicrobium sp.]